MLRELIEKEIFLYSFTDSMKTIRLDGQLNPIKDPLPISED